MSSPASFTWALAGGRRWAAVAACAMLTACGFQPMYAKAPKDTPSALAGVYVEPVNAPSEYGRMSQQFRADLEDKFNPQGRVPAAPAFRLNATLSLTESAIGVAQDGTISRYNLYLNSNYTLKDYVTGEVIATGKLRHASSYNNLTNAYYSTYVSRQDAIMRGVTEMSEMYRQRLAPYLKGQRPPVVKEINTIDEISTPLDYEADL